MASDKDGNYYNLTFLENYDLNLNGSTDKLTIGMCNKSYKSNDLLSRLRKLNSAS